MTVKEKIIGTLRATGRENIEQVIDYMENNGFFRRVATVTIITEVDWQTMRGKPIRLPCKTTPMALTSRASPFALCCTTFATVAE